MTKKHYVAIAKIVAHAAAANPGPGYNAVQGVAMELAVILKEDNPAFDRNRFLTACGFDL